MIIFPSIDHSPVMIFFRLESFFSDSYLVSTLITFILVCLWAESVFPMISNNKSKSVIIFIKQNLHLWKFLFVRFSHTDPDLFCVNALGLLWAIDKNSLVKYVFWCINYLLSLTSLVFWNFSILVFTFDHHFYFLMVIFLNKLWCLLDYLNFKVEFFVLPSCQIVKSGQIRIFG